MDKIYSILVKRGDSHGIRHALVVVEIAMKIAESIAMEPIDRLIIIHSALVHDIRDHKYINHPDQMSREDLIKIIDASINESARKYGKYDACKYGGKSAGEIVVLITENMSWTHRDENRALPVRDYLRRIVQDADMIDGMSLARSIEYHRECGESMEEQRKGVIACYNTRMSLIFNALSYDASRKIATPVQQKLERDMAVYMKM